MSKSGGNVVELFLPFTLTLRRKVYDGLFRLRSFSLLISFYSGVASQRITLVLSVYLFPSR